ncbi:MAG: hypothetical protein LJE95_12000 [Acidobacteria bacterium]|nr:hypothetical protein [Acidobacteriota bacterium]
MNEEQIDTVLRRALSPAPAMAARVAERALRQGGGSPQRRVGAIALGSLAVAGLLTLAILSPRPGSPARASEVYSVDGLVVGVSSTGTTWIVGPDAGVDADQTRMIVMRGEAQ